jgi:hypothetical protein
VTKKVVGVLCVFRACPSWGQLSVALNSCCDKNIVTTLVKLIKNDEL